jgi:hypothetical protein
LPTCGNPIRAIFMAQQYYYIDEADLKVGTTC